MSCSLVMMDTNELRAAAFSAFLASWAVQADIDLCLVHDPEDIAGLPAPAIAACLYSIGGLSLQDEEVLQTLEKIRSLLPDSPIVVFSDRLSRVEIMTAIQLGLRGFLPTTMPSHVGIAAIQFILSGGTYHPHSSYDGKAGASMPSTSALIRRIDEHRPKAAHAFSSSAAGSQRGISDPAALYQAHDGPVPGQVLEPLTKKRHMEVLEYLAQGETNKEIARHLNLTEATIKVYIRELMRHFGAKNRMQVILKASTLSDAASPETETMVSFAGPSSGYYSGASNKS